MLNLFSQNAENLSPLADRLRPKNIEDIIGQDHLAWKNAGLRRLIEKDDLSSIILWWPPWTWKTSLSSVISSKTRSNFVSFSAVEHWIADLKKIAKFSKDQLELNSKKTILFVDEIHRLNKTQQDAFLPHVEKWTFILIWATTENPSFAINSALLSRTQIYTLNALKDKDLHILVDKIKLRFGYNIDNNAQNLIVSFASWDARKLLVLLETIHKLIKWNTITEDLVRDCVKDKTILYDRNWDEHYNIISAFIKSMRWSDPDATVYYLSRMLKSWEDPRFIARRMTIFASEDVGLWDLHALPLAISVFHASERLWMPEIRIPLAHVAIYLAKAKKDNSTYRAINSAMWEVDKSWSLSVPTHLRNAPTSLMKEMWYWKWYEYAHDIVGKIPGHSHLPEEIKDLQFYFE